MAQVSCIHLNYMSTLLVAQLRDNSLCGWLTSPTPVISAPWPVWCSDCRERWNKLGYTQRVQWIFVFVFTLEFVIHLHIYILGVVTHKASSWYMQDLVRFTTNTVASTVNEIACTCTATSVWLIIWWLFGCSFITWLERRSSFSASQSWPSCCRASFPTAAAPSVYCWIFLMIQCTDWLC